MAASEVQQAPKLLDSPKTLQKPKVKFPKKYKVYLLNDDYTTMDFVVHILMSIFHMPEPKAIDTMLKVHKEGKALCGVYTKEIAETKVNKVRQLARKNEFPLMAKMEPES